LRSLKTAKMSSNAQRMKLCTKIWGVYHGRLGGYIRNLDNHVHNFLLGGISRTIGGYITDHWGVYHGPLGGISRTETPLNASSSKGYNFLKLY